MESFYPKLLEEVNFARTKPFEYAAKLLSFEKYFEGKIFRFPGERPVLTKEGFGAFNEAAHHLALMAPLQPLAENSYLMKVAENAVKDIQNVLDTHGVSLLNFDFFVEKYGWIIGSFNEAIELGSVNPEHVVMHLLTDDGDLDRGNRKHMMHPDYKLIGYSTSPHKVFGQATVLAYSTTFYSHEEESQEVKEEKKQEEKKDEETFTKEKKEISTIPKVTYTCEENDEVITKHGKKTVHSEVEKRETNEDGFLSYSYIKSSKSNFSKEKDELPENVTKIEKHEKIVLEDGKKVKVTTTKKFTKDGKVTSETSKQDL